MSYQRCPLCRGKKIIKNRLCDVCLGEKIINKKTGLPPSKYVYPYVTYPVYPVYPIYPQYPNYPYYTDPNPFHWMTTNGTISLSINN
jgi:hypothetical protein